MSRLETTSFALGTNMFLSDKHITKESFLDLTVESLLMQHHKRKGKITSFYFMDSESEDKICFLISEDKNLNKELHMIDSKEINFPDKSKDLFPLEGNTYDNIKLKNLLNSIENDVADFQLHVDNMNYNFRLSVGAKATITDQVVINYIDVIRENDANEFLRQQKCKI